MCVSVILLLIGYWQALVSFPQHGGLWTGPTEGGGLVLDLAGYMQGHLQKSVLLSAKLEPCLAEPPSPYRGQCSKYYSHCNVPYNWPRPLAIGATLGTDSNCVAVTAQSDSDGEWEGLFTRCVAVPSILTTLPLELCYWSHLPPPGMLVPD